MTMKLGFVNSIAGVFLLVLTPNLATRVAFAADPTGGGTMNPPSTGVPSATTGSSSPHSTALSTRADTQAQVPASPSPADTQAVDTDHDECPYSHRRFAGGALDILPRYFHLQNKTSAAYAQGGFNAPSSDYFGIGMILYKDFSTGWQLGISWDWLGSSQDAGTSEASFNQGYFGLYFARNFTPRTPWDVTLGTVVGYGYATMEVLSPSLNGRLTEDSAIVEPRLGLAYRISRMVKVGGMVSYLFPFAPSTVSHGQSLGLDRISAQGFSASLQLILGHWGES